MSKKLVFSQEFEQEVIDFYLDGHSLNDCVWKFGFTNRQPVKNILARHNVNLKPVGLQLTDEFEKQVVDFYLIPNTLNETVRHFNLNNRQAVKKILNHQGIELHDEKTFRKLQLEKIKATNLEKYGVEYSWQTEEVKEKIKQSNLEHFGVEYPQQSKEIREKGQQTLLENYGRTNVGYFGSPEHDAAIKEKYGVDYVTQAEEIKQKIKETNIKLYGASCAMNTPEQLEKTRHMRKNDRYIYANVTFDSFPELCFYMYNLSIGNTISRYPNKIAYEFENQTHYYFPDFEVNGELYEIKGKQFLKENGAWQNPYNHIYDAWAEAKHQCALQHNVKILYEKDYQKYLDWFDTNHYIKDNFVNN